MRKNPTLEHVQARKHGGKSTWMNCVVACYDCNSQRSHFKPFKFWSRKQQELARRAG